MLKEKEIKQVTEFSFKEKLKNFFEVSFLNKFLIISIFIVFVFLLIFIIVGVTNIFLQKYFKKVPTCGDGTFYNNCSLRKPYFCLDGVLVKKASICGCPEILTKIGDSCISKYQDNPKNITLKYVLRGKENKINFVVYRGMVDYIQNLSESIYYNKDEKPSRRDFKLRNINEKEQRELLLPLVVKIQNLAETKEDQVRIAISIVQNIAYGESGEIITFRHNQINYSRYPYEVLYDMEGICGEKSELLAFLLKELGYSTALFYYPLENHEAVGVKCPLEYSLNNTGYCFIETTGPSIITDNQNEYIGIWSLSSEPELILISDGDSLGYGLYEYKDAKTLRKINELIREKGKISWINNFRFEKIKEKYGLR